jgi:NAD(P)-dependent dehydrogenase (short-subunit alcohol dehydrogenase family)
MLITGASTGIGRATAQLFAERGWNVAATTRSPEKVRANPRDWPVRENLFLARLDVTEPESIREGVAETLVRFGSIEAVVNNAG